MLKTKTFADIYKIKDTGLRVGNGWYFWSGASIVKSDGALTRLSRNLSAVANAGEATVIIGIKALRGRAAKLEPLEFLFDADWFYHEIQTRIWRSIKGMQVTCIADENKGQYVVIRIPENNDSPHMSEDGRYYMWNGKKIVLQSEVQVRSLYHASSRSELEFIGLYSTNGAPVMKDGAMEQISFYPKLLVQNRGGEVEKDYKVELLIPAELHDIGFHALQTYLVRHEGANMVFSVPGRNPLFQDEISAPFELKLVVNADSFDVFQNSDIQIRIYYSKGVNTHQIKLSETFRYNGRKLTSNDFVPKHRLDSNSDSIKLNI